MVKCQKCLKKRRMRPKCCSEHLATICQRIIWGTALILDFILVIKAMFRINALYEGRVSYFLNKRYLNASNFLISYQNFTL
jgi:hypothetical protein